jgi:hypothetical protein
MERLLQLRGLSIERREKNLRTLIRRYNSVRLGRVASFLFLCFALVLVSSAAHAGTILQFDQTNPADVLTATQSGGVTTLSTAGNVDGGNVSIPITIVNVNGVPGLAIPAFETFVNVTSDGPALSLGILNAQRFTGSIEISSLAGGLGINYLTATFVVPGSSSVFAGVTGGTQASLDATGPPNALVFTSDLAILGPPTSMTIALSNVSPGVSVSNSSIASFTAQNAATFAATVVVPEPASLGMACTGLVLVSLAVSCERRSRRSTAKV